VRQSLVKILVLLPLLQSCEQGAQPDLHGRLYFASGNYVGEFDLAKGTSVIVANRGAVTISDISEFGENRFLLAETAIVETREVPRISWVDIETGQAETLYSGVAARYLSAHSALVWDDGSRLRATSRRRNSGISAEIVSHNLNQLSTIVAVSDEMVLFETGIPEQRGIRSYNVMTRELLQRDALTEQCRLAGSVWIADRGQLACQARTQSGEGTEYLLTDLNGTVRDRLALPPGKQFTALAYATDQQVLILTEPWRTVFGGGERFAVWAYDLGTGQIYRILGNQYLGASAVYVDETLRGATGQ
jgi:hypothetical protein